MVDLNIVHVTGELLGVNPKPVLIHTKSDPV